MTKEQKAAYYAARKARKAAKAKAAAKKVPAKKCAKKCGTACPCEKDPIVSPEERLLAAILGKDASKLMTGAVSVLERKAAFALDACRVIGNVLLDLIRVFRPDVSKLIVEHKDPAPAKANAKAK